MSNIDKYTKFIAEQVRMSSVAGFRSADLAEATERTAVKNELKNLNQHLGGEVEGSQRTGRGSQTTSPSIDTSHHSKDEVAKALQGAGYKKVPNHKFDGDNVHASYQKTDAHGFTHSLKHAIDDNGKHSINHVGANK